MRRLRVTVFLVVLALIVSITGTTYAGVNQYYKVSANELNVREDATTNSTRITQLTAGELLQRLDESIQEANGYSWYKIKILSSGKTGFVASNYIKVADIASSGAASGASATETYKVSASTLKVRVKPTTKSSSVVITLTKGAILERVDASAVKANGYTWYRIKDISSGKTGYAVSKYLTRTTQTSTATPTVAPAPAPAEQKASVKRTFYYQGESRWKFSSSVKKSACVITAYAMMINNLNISATPRTVYAANGNSTSMNHARIQNAFGVRPISALASDSPYLARFDGYRTIVANPAKNGEKAIREAIDRNPEGVICYFSGKGAHAVVAVGYNSSGIIYCDPGRVKGLNIPFKTTWVVYSHKMSYAHLREIIAVNKK